MPRSTSRQTPPENPATQPPLAEPQHMSPGDEAPQGTPGTGQNICRACRGNGIRDDGQPCPNCEGSGWVITGIGGA